MTCIAKGKEKFKGLLIKEKRNLNPYKIRKFKLGKKKKKGKEKGFFLYY